MQHCSQQQSTSPSSLPTNTMAHTPATPLGITPPSPHHHKNLLGILSFPSPFGGSHASHMYWANARWNSAAVIGTSFGLMPSFRFSCSHSSRRVDGIVGGEYGGLGWAGGGGIVWFVGGGGGFEVVVGWRGVLLAGSVLFSVWWCGGVVVYSAVVELGSCRRWGEEGGGGRGGQVLVIVTVVRLAGMPRPGFDMGDRLTPLYHDHNTL